ncbi:MAG: cation transporter [Pseudomonadota bacterium]|nr:cation transporter [Pseudomonadota bacterium]
MSETRTFSIEGMKCGHCVASATKALEAVPGVEGVKVTLDPQQAVVTGKADPAAVIKAVKEAGYAASKA